MDERPCAICSEPIYQTADGGWTHGHTAYVHPAIADEQTLDNYVADVEITMNADVRLRRPRVCTCPPSTAQGINDKCPVHPGSSP